MSFGVNFGTTTSPLTTNVGPLVAPLPGRAVDVAPLTLALAGGETLTLSAVTSATFQSLLTPAATVAPEPATITLTAGGLLVLAGVVRRRRRVPI